MDIRERVKKIKQVVEEQRRLYAGDPNVHSIGWGAPTRKGKLYDEVAIKFFVRENSPTLTRFDRRDRGRFRRRSMVSRPMWKRERSAGRLPGQPANATRRSAIHWCVEWLRQMRRPISL
jgi:hypothetical protein